MSLVYFYDDLMTILIFVITNYENITLNDGGVGVITVIILVIIVMMMLLYNREIVSK